MKAGRIYVSLQADAYGWVACIVAQNVAVRMQVFSSDAEDALRLAVEGWRQGRRARAIAREHARKKFN